MAGSRKIERLLKQLNLQVKAPGNFSPGRSQKQVDSAVKKATDELRAILSN